MTIYPLSVTQFTPFRTRRWNCGGLEAEAVVSERGLEDLAVAVASRPGEIVRAAGHEGGSAVGSPCVGAVLGAGGQEDVVAGLSGDVHVEFVVGDEVFYALGAGVVGGR